nr:MAG TPA: hypothetical protein [Caudoviricetes sp.]
MNDEDKSSFWIFQNFSMFTRLQRFGQCLHRQFFVPV